MHKNRCNKSLTLSIRNELGREKYRVGLIMSRRDLPSIYIVGTASTQNMHTIRIAMCAQ